MKTARPLKLAEDYCNQQCGFNIDRYYAFLSGYQAARDIIEAELESVRTNKWAREVAQQPRLDDVEFALKNILDKMGDVYRNKR